MLNNPFAREAQMIISPLTASNLSVTFTAISEASPDSEVVDNAALLAQAVTGSPLAKYLASDVTASSLAANLRVTASPVDSVSTWGVSAVPDGGDRAQVAVTAATTGSTTRVHVDFIHSLVR